MLPILFDGAAGEADLRWVEADFSDVGRDFTMVSLRWTAGLPSLELAAEQRGL